MQRLQALFHPDRGLQHVRQISWRLCRVLVSELILSRWNNQTITLPLTVLHSICFVAYDTEQVLGPKQNWDPASIPIYQAILFKDTVSYGMVKLLKRFAKERERSFGRECYNLHYCFPFVCRVLSGNHISDIQDNAFANLPLLQEL